MTTFLLVHGAWHGGWCWKHVVKKLQDQGHEVHAPTMTGLCERSHLASPAVNLETHIRDITGELKWKDMQDVVLVGHSYGGMVIAGAADREWQRIKAVVCIDGFVPKNGQAAFDMRPPERNQQLLDQARRGGWALPPTPAEHFRVLPENQAWVDGSCTDFPIACFTQPLQMRGGREKISRNMYIRASGYKAPMFDDLAAVVETSGWEVHYMECGHDTMVDDPGRTTELLLAAAA